MSLVPVLWAPIQHINNRLITVCALDSIDGVIC